MAQYIVGVDQALQALLAGQDQLKEMMMALTDRETQAVQGISDKLDQLTADIDRAFQAATQVNQTLHAQIDTLAAQEQTDTATITALKGAAEQMETDVLGALGGVQAKTDALDQHVGDLTPPAPPTP